MIVLMISQEEYKMNKILNKEKNNEVVTLDKYTSSSCDVLSKKIIPAKKYMRGEVKKMEGNNKPADRVKVGGIEATIWDNGNFGKTVTLQRSYKDKDDWKKTNSLRINDIPKAVLALEKAYEKIVMKE